MMTLPVIGLAHFAVGTVAIVAGAGALALRKGARPHRISGNLFFAMMLALGVSGIYMSVERSILFTMFLSILALYLVITGWMTAKRPEATIGSFEKIACAIILASALGAGGIGIAAVSGVPGLTNDIPAGGWFFMAALSGWLGALDIRVIMRGGISGKHRIARHLWRMCFSFFIAVTIFFLGNNWVLPEFLRTTFLLTAPVVAVFVLMIFWLLQVLLTNWYARQTG